MGARAGALRPPRLEAVTIRAVVFDWGGVLTPWHDVDAREQWAAFAAGFGTMACAQRDLASQLLAAEDAMWERARTGHASSDLLTQLDALGLGDSPARESGLAAYREWWLPHSLTRPDVWPTWQALRERGLKLGVLSNTLWSRQVHRDYLERDGVLELLDADVYSSEVPWTKPHPEIFREVSRRLGVTPDECVHVGDRLYEDVWGAQAVGMKTVWVPHTALPAEQVVPVDVTPDAVIDDLGDVVGVVDGWLAG